MSDHTVEFYLETESVEGKITCHVEPDKGPCKVGACPYGCDEYSVKRGVEGWHHIYYDYATDSEVRHALDPAHPDQECNYVAWIEGGDGVVHYYDGERTSVRDAPIEFEWDGDTWLWKYADAVAG